MAENFSAFVGMFSYITKNSVVCNSCTDEIESLPPNTQSSCSCGDVTVDGGHTFLRRVISKGGSYTDTSLTERYSESDIKSAILREEYRKRVDLVYSPSYYQNYIDAGKYYCSLWYGTEFNTPSRRRIDGR